LKLIGDIQREIHPSRLQRLNQFIITRMVEIWHFSIGLNTKLERVRYFMPVQSLLLWTTLDSITHLEKQ